VLMETIRDDEFYFEVVTFRVENTLFRVPRHVLETSSEVFRDMFLLPVGVGSTEGETDSHPIVLEGISSHTFKLLLKVLLDRSIAPENLAYSMDEWIAVLKLSHRWGMSSTRKFVMSKLSSKGSTLGPLEMAGLALELDIKEWLVPALDALAKREEPMSKVEVERLGIEVVLKLAEVRESLIARKYEAYTQVRQFSGFRTTAQTERVTTTEVTLDVGKRRAEHLTFQKIIQEVFRQELSK